MLAVTVLATLTAFAGVATAWFLVGKREIALTPPQDVSFATRAARADLYGDAINEGLVVSPGRRLVRGLLTFDRSGAAGVFTGGASAVSGIGGQLRKIQNGFVRSYALSVLAGVLRVVLALLAVNLS